MDLVPSKIDGAVVLNLRNSCPRRLGPCEPCTHLVLNVYNWLKHIELEYAVIDLQDEKDICPAFLEELLFLRKRIQTPFIFSGVMERPLMILERYSHAQKYPVFVSPEDAVRALRIQHPGLTEAKLRVPIPYGKPLLSTWKNMIGEA